MINKANVEINEFKSFKMLSAVFCDDFILFIKERLAGVKRPLAVAFSGGNSPLLFFELLRFGLSAEEWRRIHIFQVDERFVAPSSKLNNFTSLQESLLDYLPLSKKNIHAVTVNKISPQQSAEQYHRELTTFFSHYKLESFDCAVLGMGSDGHTASLFPESSALLEQELLAVAVSAPTSCQPHVERITVTFPVLNNAEQLFLLLKGKEKIALLNNVLNGKQADLPIAKLATKNKLRIYLAK